MHNEDEITRKDIRIGDTVTVERAGDVIPHVVAVDVLKRKKTSKKFVFPKKCPCGYETIKDLEHDDVTYYGPSGELVVGIDEHYKLSKEFLTAYPNTKWTINWSVSTDVMFTEKPIENWVTSGLSITFGDDSMNDISRVVDAKIIDGKLKTVYVYQRQLTESELE